MRPDIPHKHVSADDVPKPSDGAGETRSMNMIKYLRWVLLAAALLLVLTACAAGTNPVVDVPSAEGEVAGFWLGLWHGIITPITFVISLFSDTVSIYEVHNSGGWYDFGYVLGVGMFLGGGGAGTSLSRR